MNKGFNKPAEYAGILQGMADRGLYAITSFIFGMDGDQAGVATRTSDAIHSWPPGLPVFGLLTPYPATPLYDRLLNEKRLTRPQHWLDFRPFHMAFTPKNITIDQAEAEVRKAWSESYSAEAVAAAMAKIRHRPFKEKAVLFFARLLFRGIYFPQMRKSQWFWLLLSHRRAIVQLIREAVPAHRRPQPTPSTSTTLTS